MNWPWSRPRPPPVDDEVLAVSQDSKDTMTAAAEQLQDVVAELRAVVDQFERVAQQAGKGHDAHGR